MNKVDSARLRSVVTFLRSEFRNDGAEGESVHRVCDDAVALLDELEASHKTVAPCRFDVAAARAELARIDKGWGNGDVDAGDSFRAARALLDRALAAIDAWRPAVDIESAALTVLSCTRGEEWTHWPTGILIGEQEQCRKIARAVLAYAGGRVEPAESAPVAITDAVVEEAAVRAYCARTGDGSVNAREDWLEDREDERVDYRNEARAVLEYAAERGGVAPVQPVPLAPTVDPRTERLTRYRCAVANAQVASHETWEALWLRTRAFDSRQTFGEWCAEQCEARAHAMLAAEKEPARG